jgi:hypothetical protein
VKSGFSSSGFTTSFPSFSFFGFFNKNPSVTAAVFFSTGFSFSTTTGFLTPSSSESKTLVEDDVKLTGTLTAGRSLFPCLKNMRIKFVTDFYVNLRSLCSCCLFAASSLAFFSLSFCCCLATSSRLPSFLDCLFLSLSSNLRRILSSASCRFCSSSSSTTTFAMSSIT